MKSTIISPTSIAVKICGITSVQQARQIALLGADAIGVIGVKGSARYVNEKKRKEIFGEINQIRENIESVLVISNPSDEYIRKNLMGVGQPKVVQLHGNESPSRCRDLKSKYPNKGWWKAIGITSKSDIKKAYEFLNIVDSILLDSSDGNQTGGTGRRIPLELIKNAKIKTPWWIAGGICSNGIEELLNSLNPNGVDASSRLEVSPGIKDLGLVKDLINKVKKHNAEKERN
tara:strand:- start:141 stop:833 length:693 start_codon:yes stop_codon:yes gene_type:complete